jgi:hypothetical protein
VVATSDQLLATTPPHPKKAAAAGAGGSSVSGRGVGSGSGVGAGPSTPRGGAPLADRDGQKDHQKANCTNSPLAMNPKQT